jgi:hypothetical protein
MNKYVIDEQTLSAIINYLAQRPYSEVSAGIDALKSLNKIDEQQDSSNT